MPEPHSMVIPNGTSRIKTQSPCFSKQFNLQTAGSRKGHDPAYLRSITSAGAVMELNPIGIYMHFKCKTGARWFPTFGVPPSRPGKQ